MTGLELRGSGVRPQHVIARSVSDVAISDLPANIRTEIDSLRQQRHFLAVLLHHGLAGEARYAFFFRDSKRAVPVPRGAASV